MTLPHTSLSSLVGTHICAPSSSYAPVSNIFLLKQQKQNENYKALTSCTNFKIPGTVLKYQGLSSKLSAIPVDSVFVVTFTPMEREVSVFWTLVVCTLVSEGAIIRKQINSTNTEIQKSSAKSHKWRSSFAQVEENLFRVWMDARMYWATGTIRCVTMNRFISE